MRGVALCKVLWYRTIIGLGLRLPWLQQDRTRRGEHGANAPTDAAAQDAAHADATNPEWRHICDLTYRAMRDEAANEARRHAAGAIPADTGRDLEMFPDNAGAPQDELLVVIRRSGRSLIQRRLTGAKTPAFRLGMPRFDASTEHQRPKCRPAEEQWRDLTPPRAASADCSSPQAEPRAAAGKAFRRTETAPAMYRPVVPHQAREVAATARP
jgi:hypothetical protein